jgi:hypothetical protein
MCPECARLLAVCERLNGIRAAAMQNLLVQIARRLPFGELQRLLATVNEVWLEMDRATQKLEEHKQSHAHGDTA